MQSTYLEVYIWIDVANLNKLFDEERLGGFLGGPEHTSGAMPLPWYACTWKSSDTSEMCNFLLIRRIFPTRLSSKRSSVSSWRPRRLEVNLCSVLFTCAWCIGIIGEELDELATILDEDGGGQVRLDQLGLIFTLSANWLRLWWWSIGWWICAWKVRS